MAAALSLLDYALLGLLSGGPRSGYDLRKTFQETPLGHYSDSPGSIYPALGRLEARRLIRSASAGGSRRRRAFSAAPGGVRALRAWLAEPVDAATVANTRGALELKLAFYSEQFSPKRLRDYLGELATALDTLHRETAAAARTLEPNLTPSGRIALELGIYLIHARAAWLRRARRRR